MCSKRASQLVLRAVRCGQRLGRSGLAAVLIGGGLGVIAPLQASQPAAAEATSSCTVGEPTTTTTSLPLPSATSTAVGAATATTPTTAVPASSPVAPAPANTVAATTTATGPVRAGPVVGPTQQPPTVSGSSVTVHWTAPPSLTCAPLLEHYEIEEIPSAALTSPSVPVQSTTVAQTTCSTPTCSDTLSGLAPGSYELTVVGLDAAGDASPPSNLETANVSSSSCLLYPRIEFWCDLEPYPLAPIQDAPTQSTSGITVRWQPVPTTTVNTPVGSADDTPSPYAYFIWWQSPSEWWESSQVGFQGVGPIACSVSPCSYTLPASSLPSAALPEVRGSDAFEIYLTDEAVGCTTDLCGSYQYSWAPSNPEVIDYRRRTATGASCAVAE